MTNKPTKRQKLLAKLNAGKGEIVDHYLPPMVPVKKKRGPYLVAVGEAFVPTVEQRESVAQLRSCGWEVKDISKALRIPERTLNRHFKVEITDGAQYVRGMIARGIARGALAGDKSLMIFYAKSQMGWVDTKPWGYGTPDKNGQGGAPALFTVNIMGLGGGQTSVTATGPTIEAAPENQK